MTMFLDDLDLFELTGYKQPARQIAQLKAQKIPFHVNAAGHPKVARAILEGQRKEKATAEKRSWSPSWGASHQPT